MANDEEAEQPAIKRERSPSFPYIDLDTSVDLALRLYRAARMNEVRLADAAVAWGMTGNSGSFLRYVAAVGQFGLVESSGSGDQRRIKLSNQARRILEDDRPGVKEKLLSDAALQPKFIRGFFLGEDGMPHWGRDRPSDNIAESTLKFDYDFSAEAARRFLIVYDASVKHVISETAVVEDEKLGDQLPTGTPESTTATRPTLAFESTVAAQTPMKTLELNKINFRSEGPGIISISATLDAEGLDLLEKKIAAFKLLLS